MTTDAAPTLLLVTGDLFLGSRIRGLAEGAGYRVMTALSVARAAQLAADAPPSRVVIDLAIRDADPSTLGGRIGVPPTAIAGYAPHVRVELLKAARAAGLGAVLTKGQLEDDLPAWLKRA